MNSFFKFGGWLFLIIGLSLIVFNIDVLGDWWEGSETGNGFFGLVPLLIGIGQAFLGLIFIRLSSFMGEGGIGDGLIQRQKLEQKIMEMESRGMDTTRYKKILDKMDGRDTR